MQRSRFVSLPSKNGVYYVVDKFTTLADGSQIVYFYGDEQALSAITDNQSSLFAQSFNDAFLSLDGIGVFSFLTGTGIGIAAGGGSSDNPNTNPPINADPPVIDPPVIDPAADNFAPSASFSDVLEVGRNTDIFKDMSKNFDDVNGDTLTYKAEPNNGGLLPSWLTFEADTGIFTGTAPDTAGPVEIHVWASDAWVESSNYSVLIINVVNNAPDYNASPDDNFAIDTVSNPDWAVDLDDKFTDPNGDVLTYAVNLYDNLGAIITSYTADGIVAFNNGVEFDTNTHILTGRANIINTRITIVAEDLYGATSNLVTAGFKAVPIVGEMAGNPPGDTLTGGFDYDVLYGTEGNDYLVGNEGHDVLYGNEGDDEIEGNEGHDYLYGGEGDDYLTGGAGKDRFVYDDIGDGDDTIYDFQVGTGTNADVLDLAALLTYDPNNPNHDINDFISFIVGSISGDTITKLNIDANGDGSGTDVSILLRDVTGTSLSDLINDGNIVLF